MDYDGDDPTKPPVEGAVDHGNNVWSSPSLENEDDSSIQKIIVWHWCDRKISNKIIGKNISPGWVPGGFEVHVFKDRQPLDLELMVHCPQCCSKNVWIRSEKKTNRIED